MAKMIRKQVYIRATHDRLLKQRARALGVTEAELIRRGIDQLTHSTGSTPDPSAWDEARRWIERHRSRKVPQTGRTWRRDDLYEERVARLARR
jgi:hypothetical protein